MSGSDIVFSVDVSMQLCVLKYILDRFTGIVGHSIKDNVVINENIQMWLIIVILTFSLVLSSKTNKISIS